LLKRHATLDRGATPPRGRRYHFDVGGLYE